MPELAHGFRAKGAESKELLDTAIKQAPTHQKACNLVISQAFHMHHLKGIQYSVPPSGLFWAKLSGFGPDFAQKSGFFIKIMKVRLVCID